MAQWRKVVVSGSSAVLNQVSASGNIVPKTTDGSSLGTSTLQFSDLFLGEGAVINWDGGDFTATQTNNLLALSGGNTRVDRLEVDSANDYVDVDTDLKVVAAADITLDPGGNNVKPGSDNADALGVSGTAWSDLFLGDGAVINFNAGDVTATHSSNLLSIAGGNTRVIRLEIDSASDYLDVDTDLKIVANADISLEPGGSDVLIGGNRLSGSAASTGSFGYLNVHGDGVFGGDLTFGDAATDSVTFGADISSNLLPNTDDTYDLGSASQAWQDLFLEGDITLTDAGKLVSSAGNLTADSEAGSLILDGHTGVDIDASNSGKVAIDGAGGIDIGVNADVAIDVDSSTFDLDASGAVTIDGATGSHFKAAGTLALSGSAVTIAGGGGSEIDITTTGGAIDVNSATLDVDTSAGITMTSTTMAFDPSSTFDLDAAGAITIDGSSITLGGDADTAFDIDTSTLDIDSSGAVTIDGATGSHFKAAGTLALSGSAVTIAGGGGSEIDITTTGGAIDVNSDTLDVDTSAGITMTSTTMAFDPSSTFDIDAAGAVTIDGSAITIGGDNDNAAINIGYSTSEVTIGDNLTVTGDLTVNGDQTILNTTNLAVTDAFIFAASGSAASNADGGLIVQSGSSEATGSAIYHDTNDNRWAVAKSIKAKDTSVAALEHVVTAKQLGDDDAAVEGDKEYGPGEMAINSDGTIWIYS
jgi:hypothetical protein